MSQAGRTVAIVQARLGSTRLPRKVLMPLAGTPMVLHVLRRASAITGVDEVVAAIPDLAEDDELVDVIRVAGFRVSRGSADDVLARYVTAATATAADVVVRITSDCPLISPSVSSLVAGALAEGDYASNTLRRTFPRGLDTEAVVTTALATAHREAIAVSEREHVTPFVWRQPERFVLHDVIDRVDRSTMRWTVDTYDDLAFATAVYDELGPAFEFEDALGLLQCKPEISELNRHVEQKPLL